MKELEPGRGFVDVLSKINEIISVINQLSRENGCPNCGSMNKCRVDIWWECKECGQEWETHRVLN
jgi:ribosomal protein L37AE/L43A